MENIQKEKEYKIRIGATGKYMQTGNNRDTEKFLAFMEGKKVWIHEFDENEDDFSEIWVSQYEKTRTYKIPVELLEEYIEEIEPEIEKIPFNYIEYFKRNKNVIIASFLMIFVIIFSTIDLKSLKSNILESKQETIKEKTIFETLTDREIMLSKKEDLELQEQKEFREKISASKKRVEDIRKEKSEIAKQKLESAQ